MNRRIRTRGTVTNLGYFVCGRVLITPLVSILRVVSILNQYKSIRIQCVLHPMNFRQGGGKKEAIQCVCYKMDVQIYNFVKTVLYTIGYTEAFVKTRFVASLYSKGGIILVTSCLSVADSVLVGVQRFERF